MANGAADLPSQAKVGSGAAIAVDKTVSEYGLQSLKLTHGKVVGNQTTVGRVLPGGYRTKLGFEAAVYNKAASIRFNMVMISQLASAGQQYGIQVTTNTVSANINFYSQMGVYTPFLTGVAPIISSGFHNFKAVFDTAQGIYDSLWINGVRYPLGDLFLPYNGALLAPAHQSFFFTFTVEARVAANAFLNLGSVVLTIDEP
jgi:hypothetical protein